MKTVFLHDPKFIYKDGKPIEVILDIETYTKILNFIETTKSLSRKNTPITFEKNGIKIIRNGKPKTGKDIAKYAGIWKDKKNISDSLEYARLLRKKAHTRMNIQEALRA